MNGVNIIRDILGGHPTLTHKLTESVPYSIRSLEVPRGQDVRQRFSVERVYLRSLPKPHLIQTTRPSPKFAG